MSNPNPPNSEPQQIQQAIEQVQQNANLTKNGGIPLEVRLETGQVYTGTTPQEVLDKLVAAQTEASRTLTARNQELEALRHEVTTLKQATPPPAPTDKQTRVAEYYSKWSEDPTEATKMVLADMLGLPADVAVPVLQQAVSNSIVDAASNEFKTRCPDFPENAQNAAMLARAVEQKYGKSLAAASADNLEIAYHELVRNGHITPNALPTAGIAQPNQVLPNLRGNSANPNPVVDVLSQARTMPLDQLKQVIENLQTANARR